MVFPALKEAEERLKAKQDELGKIFAEAGETVDLDKVKAISGTTDEKAKYIRDLNTECGDLGKKAEELRGVQKAADAAKTWQEQSGSDGEPGVEPGDGNQETKGLNLRSKTVGDEFVKSGAFKHKGDTATLELDVVKTLLDRTGMVPESVRGPRIVEFPTRPIQVLDLIPTTTTGQGIIKYMEETTRTNAAAETAEGATYPEAALALTERSSVVEKIAVWLPITDETLEDEPRTRGYINNRLPFMLRQRMDSQVVVGNGTTPNLRGILNVVGIQTQAKGADPVPDAVYKAMTKIRVTGRAVPDAALFHPNDWQDVRLLRTADGIYIWGSPMEAGPERIWGLQVVQAEALTENTGLVGDFANFTELAMRRGIEVQTTNAHADFFINGKQAIRADVRAAFVVYRPTAFCTVTGI